MDYVFWNILTLNQFWSNESVMQLVGLMGRGSGG